MNQYDVTEFVINNKDLIVSHLDKEMHHFNVASRIFDSFPELQDDFINHKKLSILRHYLLNHFPSLNMEDISLLCDEEMLKLLNNN